MKTLSRHMGTFMKGGLLLGLGLQASVALADGGKATLMISIDKTVAPEQVSNYVEQLNHQDPTLSTCYASTRVLEYISYDSAENVPYYGIAMVELEWSCESSARARIKFIDELPEYTVYSNPLIRPGN